MGASVVSDDPICLVYNETQGGRLSEIKATSSPHAYSNASSSNSSAADSEVGVPAGSVPVSLARRMASAEKTLSSEQRQHKARQLLQSSTEDGSKRPKSAGGYTAPILMVGGSGGRSAYNWNRCKAMVFATAVTGDFRPTC
jgi:hypothetical protein